jgi:hypothetical protein
MNNPYGMVWWLGHGDSTTAYLGYIGCGPGVILNNPGFIIPELNNNFPSFVYQGSCSNGYPEDWLSLGSSLLRNGAIATVCASRESWFNNGSWNAGMKHNCDIFSIGYYYGRELVSNEKKSAVALYDIKSDMGINGGLGEWRSWMNLFDFNLYGSPETEIITKYDLNISANQGGNTSPSTGTYVYPAGTDVEVTAIPETNYRFTGWTGDVLYAGNPITITLDSDKSIIANFVRQFILNINCGAGGRTNPPPGNYTHDTGTDISIRAIPNIGYKFTEWTGSVTSSSNPIAITMDSDKSMTANFREIPEEKGKGLCFIATAAYGTSSHPHLDILREFRDKYLLPNKLGRDLVGLYYKYSPPIAHIISKYGVLRVVVRISIIPLVAFSFFMIHLGPLATGAIFLFIVFLSIFFLHFHKYVHIRGRKNIKWDVKN